MSEEKVKTTSANGFTWIVLVAAVSVQFGSAKADYVHGQPLGYEVGYTVAMVAASLALMLLGKVGTFMSGDAKQAFRYFAAVIAVCALISAAFTFLHVLFLAVPVFLVGFSVMIALIEIVDCRMGR